ncbi:hypothetical protein C8R43DRAFT_1102827 [Mycena crocata]|nr:hypothetical protein C8R43DRAFT_1102827 [Mycena crocata]
MSFSGRCKMPVFQYGTVPRLSADNLRFPTVLIYGWLDWAAGDQTKSKDKVVADGMAKIHEQMNLRLNVTHLNRRIGNGLRKKRAKRVRLLVSHVAVFGYRTKNHDNWMMKVVVGIAGFVNAIDTLAKYDAVYLYAVAHWGDTHYLAIQNWLIVVHFVATGFIGTLVQGFMLYRFWRMTRHSITVGILVVVSLASFAGCTAVDTSIHPFFSERGDAGIYVTLWLIAGMVPDVGIAASLVWRLHRVKTDLQPAKSLIRRLITSAISTGTSTSIIAVFAYLHEPASNIAISVTLILGRVYSCTMLYLLNNRSKMCGEMPNETVEVGLSMTFNLGGILLLIKSPCFVDSSVGNCIFGLFKCECKSNCPLMYPASTR